VVAWWCSLVAMPRRIVARSSGSFTLPWALSFPLHFSALSKQAVSPFHFHPLHNRFTFPFTLTLPPSFAPFIVISSLSISSSSPSPPFRSSFAVLSRFTLLLFFFSFLRFTSQSPLFLCYAHPLYHAVVASLPPVCRFDERLFLVLIDCRPIQIVSSQTSTSHSASVFFLAYLPPIWKGTTKNEERKTNIPCAQQLEANLRISHSSSHRRRNAQ
jgi:hypothetical protein